MSEMPMTDALRRRMQEDLAQFAPVRPIETGEFTIEDYANTDEDMDRNAATMTLRKAEKAGIVVSRPARSRHGRRCKAYRFVKEEGE